MSIDTLIARMRRKERAQWRSEGKVTRPSGTTTFDPNTGEEVEGPPTAIYEGKMQVRSSKRIGFVFQTQAGEEEISLSALVIKLPVDAAIAVDDIVKVMATDYDAGLVGRTFRITRVAWDDWQIVRLAMIEEVT